ncbi:N-acetylglucosamine kinase [Paenibacillus thermotolerans]|uniref:N-acetylglucosamine kinase n=1 Tax=Paenibacillus thermotolerans TaxID=3027807 RepID=UPI002368EE88|nr:MULTISPECIES: BadF/BadG/BcrA/BcrD ATPase family protein [unclassified Paenibacillus]
MANRNVVIGVDGGNSKTDYLLFDADGNYIDHIHAGTCSHERFPDAYASTYRMMSETIGQLLERNRLTLSDVAAAAFGLAGADLPSQKERLCEVIERIGFGRYAVDNDSFLGVKAGTSNGYGVCSINGSGMCTGGISPSGKRLQIGGIGSELTGDEAGGYYIGRKILRTVYDSFYRMGRSTEMADPVMELLGVSSKELFIETAADLIQKRAVPNTELMRIMFAAAENGDPAALDIIDHSAKQLALSTAGCIRNLDFGDEVDIVLAGSVWVKAESPLLLDTYKQYVEQWTLPRCRFIVLDAPPATGAVFWALELALGRPADEAIRRKIMSAPAYSGAGSM